MASARTSHVQFGQSGPSLTQEWCRANWRSSLVPARGCCLSSATYPSVPRRMTEENRNSPSRLRRNWPWERPSSWSPARRLRFRLVDDGSQPEPSGRADRAGHHQPGAHDWQHRPTRHRAELDHRPVQRDGFPAVLEHHEPAGRSDILRKLYPKDPYVEINPADAADLGLGPAQWVFVESPRGQARVRAFITPTVQQGHLFLPMHDSSTNRLT